MVVNYGSDKEIRITVDLTVRSKYRADGVNERTTILAEPNRKSIRDSIHVTKHT